MVLPAGGGVGPVRTSASARVNLPCSPLAASAARRFVRAALADWAALEVPAADRVTDRVADEAVLLVSELVTNAVVHAGTAVEVSCALDVSDREGEPPSLVVEVTDHHPTRVVRGDPPSADEPPEYAGGHGLRLVAEIAESWGTTYRRATKSVWFQMAVAPTGPAAAGGMGSGFMDAAAAVDVGDAVDAANANAAGPDGGFGTGVVPGGLESAPEGLGTVGEDRKAAVEAVEIVAPAQGLVPVGRDPEWTQRGALSFLAEASDLLAGQFDEDMVTSLAGQLLVPRLADWCAIWLDSTSGPPRLARVWHASEGRIEGLRQVLEKEPPHVPTAVRGSAVEWPWPADPAAYGPGGAALACRLVAGGRALGTLLLGRAGLVRMPAEVVGLIEDFARRVALALASARRYTRQATISRVLQRGLLPSVIPRIPGVESAVVYEPTGEISAGGDFYDVFPAGDGRWCFVLGDVCGNGPEAAVVTGLVRPWLRLLAREGYGVGEVLDRLNQLLGEEAVEQAVEGAAEAVVAGVEAVGGPAGVVELVDGGLVGGAGMPTGGGVARFLSLLYGELEPLGDGLGVRCTLASAGHPLPLVLRPDGEVRTVAAPQILLGVVDDVSYESESFDLTPGETLLCVTDGVTEHRSGDRQFDDEDGLAAAFALCGGLSARQVAERVRRAVDEFAAEPPDDDLAMLVLKVL
ncbi:ATP-binding SpoIIE family protein phosphatase [Streptomyces rapamycinicus]|uniref:Protein phosphatase n=2 Tax=Streptomyces rapamycinicus TaxID=1226757 RepID=A0A0A0NTA4_STRRN|nr:ATP-binding SpoIIE family protein phosphatase [Streptomyces rapamycinicus]AGP57905.1 protein phosphatase [Streptomyces rapamycinicus NRRL 5491]MBB4785572.1 anti-sigma regulatory factor (Ser/Thr protein kinase) [Streptomyces rapamycinicus]RLV78962.1 protein phosphatase [Streptomyces rapamycinicus NRRL 5491]UTO65742.1 SpoIIE family protein phosphatase [Streptomyces rapamycinicus]UTP33699.1 SpoIIE family protein phosphatase [Streptomyces rapamycinicus NRRL 5491]